jgi:hypothetical protein
MNTPKKPEKETIKSKKEAFEPPKAVDLTGKEIEGKLDDKNLEHVAGSGHLCLGGGLAQ